MIYYNELWNDHIILESRTLERGIETQLATPIINNNRSDTNPK